jgi:hypothetical protein
MIVTLTIIALLLRYHAYKTKMPHEGGDPYA